MELSGVVLFSTYIKMYLKLNFKLCFSPVSVTGYYLDYSSLEDSRESEHPRGILDAITGFIPGFGPRPRPTRRPRPPGPGQRPPINVSNVVFEIPKFYCLSIVSKNWSKELKRFVVVFYELMKRIS